MSRSPGPLAFTFYSFCQLARFCSPLRPTDERLPGQCEQRYPRVFMTGEVAAHQLQQRKRCGADVEHDWKWWIHQGRPNFHRDAFCHWAFVNDFLSLFLSPGAQTANFWPVFQTGPLDALPFNNLALVKCHNSSSLLLLSWSSSSSSTRSLSFCSAPITHWT